MTLTNKNIVFVLATTELGGAEKQSILLARGLREKWQSNVSFICYGKQGGRCTELLEQYGFEYSIIRSFSLYKILHFPFALIAMFRFLLELRKRKVEIVMPYCYESNIWSGLVRPFLGKGVKVIWNQRDDGRGIMSDRINRRAIPNCAHFIANSDAGAAYLIKDLLIREQMVSVIYNGVEEALPAVSRTEWRKQHGFTETGLLVCMLANLHDQKDHETLLKAWALLLAGKENKEGHRLLLAGRPQNTEDKLKQLAAASGIADSVVFMGGVKEVHSMLGAIDISVLCAFEKSEGLPNAVLESMLHSLPVLGSDVAALHCALGEDMKSWLSPVGNSEKLATNMGRLFESEALRKELGAKNKRRQQEVFSVDALITNSAKLITSITGS